MAGGARPCYRLCMSSLLADYFGYHRGAPPGLTRIARSHIQLLAMVDPSKSNPTSNSRSTIPYWERYVKVDHLLRAWLKTEEAFVPPQRWFAGCALEGIVTPLEFARDVMPRSPRKDALKYDSTSYKTWTFNIPDLPLLAAHAHGWTLRGDELERAKVAADTLTEVPQFLVYSQYSLDHIPTPFSERSFQHRTSARYRLEFDPLALTPASLKLAVPDWARTPAGIRTHGLPRSEVAGSTKVPHFLDGEGERVNT